MDIPYKDGWQDVHKGLGLRDAIREAIGTNDVVAIPGLVEALKESQEYGDCLDMRLNSFGFSAMHLACKHGRDKIVSILLDHKASVNCLTQNRDTPLHCAVRSGCNMMRAVRGLLHAKCDVTVQDRITRRTALHWACTFDGQRDAACAIANQTADYSRKDCEGKTAADIARENGFDDVLGVITFMQDSKNREEVMRRQELGEGNGKQREMSRKDKLLLNSKGRLGEEMRRKSAEAARQEQFRLEKEALIAKEAERIAENLAKRQQAIAEKVATMRARVEKMERKQKEEKEKRDQLLMPDAGGAGGAGDPTRARTPGGTLVRKKNGRLSVDFDVLNNPGEQRHRLEDTFATQQRRVYG